MRQGKQFTKKAAAMIAGLVIVAALLCAAVPGPTEAFYINDYAQIFSESEEAHILEQSKVLEDETGAQLVVLTVPSLDGVTAKAYAKAVLRDWGVGRESSGTVVLLCKQEGVAALSANGVAFELDQIVAINKTEEQYAADTSLVNAMAFYDAVLAAIREQYGLAPHESYTSGDKGNDHIKTLMAVILALFFAVFINGRMRKSLSRQKMQERNPRRKDDDDKNGGYGGPYRGFGAGRKF